MLTHRDNINGECLREETANLSLVRQAANKCESITKMGMRHTRNVTLVVQIPRFHYLRGRKDFQLQRLQVSLPLSKLVDAFPDLVYPKCINEANRILYPVPNIIRRFSTAGDGLEDEEDVAVLGEVSPDRLRILEAVICVQHVLDVTRSTGPVVTSVHIRLQVSPTRRRGGGTDSFSRTMG